MEVKIFNLNCWLLPVPFSVGPGRRLYRIISLIKKHNPDIITLQEVWLKKYVRRLKRELPQYQFFSSRASLFNRGGLVSGFKVKPLLASGGHFPFTEIHNRREKIAFKGYHIFEAYPGLYIINTQLYAPEKNHELKITVSQLKQIEEISKDKKVILSGDLNLKEDFLIERDEVFNYEPLGHFTVSRKNKYCGKRFNKPEHANKVIDYIVKNSDLKLKTNVVNPVMVSDHYAMIGILNF